jgi:hypothetical protein
VVLIRHCDVSLPTNGRRLGERLGCFAGQRYFRAAAKPIGVAWRFAVNGDLNLPEVEGPRPLSLRIANRYVDRIQIAAESDLGVAEQFTKVVALVDPPTRLLRPQMMIRVAAANLRRHEGRTGGSSTRAQLTGLAQI